MGRGWQLYEFSFNPVQVTDGKRVVRCGNGVPMLKLITATGCSVTALIAAVLAVAPDKPLLAAATALCVFGYDS